ncbi:MAG: hypothetical protein P8Y44_02475 [Acidobacteriota bacterium]
MVHKKPPEYNLLCVISFITLFLGLALGPQHVELHVDDAIASVELLLDGRPVARIDGPPWIGNVTFGDELSPHLLEAVAFDGAGEEMGRAQQTINMPRPAAEASVFVDDKMDGIHKTARVTWESLVEAEPSSIRVSFDGKRLPVTDPEAIPLPDHDPEQLHVIRADLEFAGIVSTKAELIFGGAYADQVSTELTAVPVTLDGDDELPPIEHMQSWFSHEHEPLRAVAAEKGLAEIVVVRDLGAKDDLTQIRRKAMRNRNLRAWWFSSPQSAWNQWAFELFWPLARRQSGAAGMYDLFPPTGKYRAKDGSLHGWITTLQQPAGSVDSQRLADCVAVAGVTAAGGNRRRAVVLVLAGRPRDSSDLSPQLAQHYLSRLRVPLYVWTTRPNRSVDDSGWGNAIDVSTEIKMARATEELFKSVERQRMIWLDGFFVPHRIELAPQIERVSMVGLASGSN